MIANNTNYILWTKIIDEAAKLKDKGFGHIPITKSEFEEVPEDVKTKAQTEREILYGLAESVINEAKGVTEKAKAIGIETIPIMRE